MLQAIHFATLAMQWAQTLAETGGEVVELLGWARPLVQKMGEDHRNPTQQEWDELNRRIAEIRTRLHSDSV